MSLKSTWIDMLWILDNWRRMVGILGMIFFNPPLFNQLPGNFYTGLWQIWVMSSWNIFLTYLTLGSGNTFGGGVCIVCCCVLYWWHGDIYHIKSTDIFKLWKVRDLGFKPWDSKRIISPQWKKAGLKQLNRLQHYSGIRISHFLNVGLEEIKLKFIFKIFQLNCSRFLFSFFFLLVLGFIRKIRLR